MDEDRSLDQVEERDGMGATNRYGAEDDRPGRSDGNRRHRRGPHSYLRTRSNSPPRSERRTGVWMTASKSGKHREKPHTPYDGAQIRRDRINSGALNTRTTQSGNLIKVPVHQNFKPRNKKHIANTKPDQLPPSSNNPTSTAPNNPTGNRAKPSYAAVADSAGNTREEYFISIFRKDRGPFNRDHQYKLQFGLAEPIRLAALAGRTGKALAHNGTKLEPKCIKIYCNSESGPFYKQTVLNLREAGLPPLEAFLPHELMKGHLIYAQLPKEGLPLIPHIIEHFCAGTWFAIQPAQVQLHRKSWHTATSNVHIQLEVDDAAFAHLKACNWMSALGLYVVTWGIPSYGRFTGYMAPDTIINQVLAQYRASSSTQPQPPTTSESSPSVPTPSSSNNPSQDINIFEQYIQSQQQLSETIRFRHVTGEECKVQQQQIMVTSPSPLTSSIPIDTEMAHHSESESQRDTSFTESELLRSPGLNDKGVFNRDLNVNEADALLGELDSTITSDFASTPKKQLTPDHTQTKKQRKKIKTSGEPMTDPSDTEPEDSEQGTGSESELCFNPS